MNTTKKAIYIIFASILFISIVLTLYIYFSGSFKNSPDRYVNIYDDNVDDQLEIY